MARYTNKIINLQPATRGGNGEGNRSFERYISRITGDHLHLKYPGIVFCAVPTYIPQEAPCSTLPSKNVTTKKKDRFAWSCSLPRNIPDPTPRTMATWPHQQRISSIFNTVFAINTTTRNTNTYLVASYDSLIKQRSAVPSSTGASVSETSSNLVIKRRTLVQRRGTQIRARRGGIELTGTRGGLESRKPVTHNPEVVRSIYISWRQCLFWCISADYCTQLKSEDLHQGTVRTVGQRSCPPHPHTHTSNPLFLGAFETSSLCSSDSREFTYRSREHHHNNIYRKLEATNLIPWPCGYYLDILCATQSKSLHYSIRPGERTYSCFTFHICKTPFNTFSGGRNVVPIRTISDDQSSSRTFPDGPIRGELWGTNCRVSCRFQAY